MRVRSIMLMVSLFLIISGIPAIAEEDWEAGLKELQPAIEESQEKEFDVDLVRRLKIEALKWKVKYWKCLMTNSEFTAREAQRQVDQANREIRALLMGAPNIKEQKKEDPK